MFFWRKKRYENAFSEMNPKWTRKWDKIKLETSAKPSEPAGNHKIHKEKFSQESSSNRGPPAWARQPVFGKQALGQVFQSWAQNLDRFLWTGFFQVCISDRTVKQDWKTGNRASNKFLDRTGIRSEFLSSFKTCLNFCFLSFDPVLLSCLKNRSEKTLSRVFRQDKVPLSCLRTCPRTCFLSWKPVLPVCLKNDPVKNLSSSPSRFRAQDWKACLLSLFFFEYRLPRTC